MTVWYAGWNEKIKIKVEYVDFLTADTELHTDWSMTNHDVFTHIIRSLYHTRSSTLVWLHISTGFVDLNFLICSSREKFPRENASPSNMFVCRIWNSECPAIILKHDTTLLTMSLNKDRCVEINQ